MMVFPGHSNGNCEFLRERGRFEEGIGNSKFTFGHFETEMPVGHPMEGTIGNAGLDLRSEGRAREEV